MGTTIQQAGINAMATFLAAQMSGVDVVGFWPEGDEELPPKRVTIIRAGERVRIPYIIDGAPAGSRELDPVSATEKEYRWDVAVFRQPIQIDIWATSEVSLNEIEDQLDTELHRGPRYTLGQQFGDPVRDGLLLALDAEDGHEGYVDITFSAEPTPMYSPDQVARREWRSMIRGEMQVSFSVWAQTPRIAELILNARVGAEPLGSAPLATSTIST